MFQYRNFYLKLFKIEPFSVYAFFSLLVFAFCFCFILLFIDPNLYLKHLVDYNIRKSYPFFKFNIYDYLVIFLLNWIKLKIYWILCLKCLYRLLFINPLVVIYLVFMKYTHIYKQLILNPWLNLSFNWVLNLSSFDGGGGFYQPPFYLWKQQKK